MCLAQGHNIEPLVGSNPGPLDLKSYTLPLPHCTPLFVLRQVGNLKAIISEYMIHLTTGSIVIKLKSMTVAVYFQKNIRIKPLPNI